MELSTELLSSLGYLPNLQAQGDGFIQGLWGESVGELTAVQRFSEGDFLLGAWDDDADRWIVRRKLWLNTYNRG